MYMQHKAGAIQRFFRWIWHDKAINQYNKPKEEPFGCDQCQLMLKLCAILDKQFDLTGPVAAPAPSSEEEALRIVQQHQESVMQAERDLMQE